ncbi:O-antigen ligase family protein [Humibacillus xanthopallidus]|uniref:O-antigen ligase family protein n=1 Tax=Humibacillus xanthopallidus TaxID=412689 RepID=UPI00163B2F81|nr:O-antigen ligase family protein [Humibacillus xanthopallidus]
MALVLVALLVASLALTGPDWVTAVAVGMLFLNVGVLATLAGGSSITPMLPYLLLLLPALYQVLVNRAPVIWGWPMTAMLTFALVAALSTVVSSRPGDSFPTLVQWLLEGLIFFFALTNSIRTLSALRRCIQALVVAGAVVGLFVAYQQRQGNFYDTYLGLAQVSAPYDITSSSSSVLSDGVADGSFRAAGMLGEPNFFAMVMTALTPWAAYLVITARGLARRMAWAIAGMLASYAVFVTYSRGALLAAGAVLVLLALWGVLPRKALIYLSAAGALAVMAVPTLADRLATLGSLAGGGPSEDASAAGRLSEVEAAWNVFATHPFVGVGPGQFPLYYQRYVSLTGGSVHSGEGARNAHNIVLGLAADIGLLGLGAFVILVTVVVVGLARARSHTRLRGVATAALVSVCFYLGCSAFLHLAYARYLWLYLALSTAIISLALGEDTTDPPTGSQLRDAEAEDPGAPSGPARHRLQGAELPLNGPR